MTTGRAAEPPLAMALLAMALLAPSPASAHVAASVDDNNRYLKLSLLGDRVRLTYTVFFGKVPGKAMRPSIDRNRDGQLDGAETDAFARRLAAEVEGQLAIAIDGETAPLRFAQVSFGSVTSAVNGDAFSIDLVTTLCMAPAAAHRLQLRDRFALPRPGETEVQLEDGPDIAVTAATVGEHHAADGLLRFAGPVPALGEPGLELAFRAGPGAVALRDGACAPGGDGGSGTQRGALRWLLPLGAALLALAALTGLGRRAARRRSTESAGPSAGASG